MSQDTTEMTLKQWCEELPSCHTVNKQLVKVLAVVNAAQEACARAETSSQERFNTQDKSGFYYELGESVRDLGRI